MTDVPHFSLPFRFMSPYAAVSEQDSIDEIADCVYAVLVCPQGFRVELPDFGLLDPTFSTPRVDENEIREALTLWEPRATTRFERAEPPTYDELVDDIQTFVQVRTGE